MIIISVGRVFCLDIDDISVGRVFCLDIDDCAGVSCNNGTCVDGVNEYTCNCNSGYTGEHCNTGNIVTQVTSSFVCHR